MLSIFLALIVLVNINIFSQQISAEIIPKDPDLRFGKLPNGITYYVRHNNKPQNRASFYIIQNAGALMEDDDQNGMAHFLEHMAFNGTGNFPGKSLINTLEKRGITFGKNINAYTNFNETVFNLSDIQTNDPGLIDTCLLILHDWSNNISLEDDEIENERGVIAEEYRTRKSGNLRTYFQTLQFILAGSRYAVRDIIGSMDVILKGKPERMRDLYHDWYRTDLQAVIVVGDIDPADMERKIINVLGTVPRIENPVERPFYFVPIYSDNRYTVITDKEVTRSTISAYTLFEAGPRYSEDRSYIEKSVIISLFNSMIRTRITELLQKAEDPPFISGTIAYGGYVRGYEVFYSAAGCEPGKENTAFESLLIEQERMKRYGFTGTELEIAKNEMLGALENEYKSEKFNEEYVQEYKDNFLTGIPVPSREYEFRVTKDILEKITLDTINLKMREWTTKEGRTYVLTINEKDSLAHLTESELYDMLEKVRTLDIAAYEDEDISKPLISEDLTGTSIIKEKRLKDFGAVEWKLANNAKVVYKYSDLEKNDVRFSAFSPGGTSVFPADMLESAEMVTYLIPWFGLGDFDAISLQKKLKGKNVSLNPVFTANECLEGFRGASSPEDFEILLQLLYLYFEKPRFDSKAFENIITRNIRAAANRYNDPENIISDSLTLIMNNYHERTKLSGTPAYFEKVKLDEVERIYRDRIKDAGDFVFFIVGNIGEDTVRRLVEKYIGSISDDSRTEKWIDNGVRFPKGKERKEIQLKMEEPKSTIVINYSKNLKYNAANILSIDVISRILKIKYTETIREREGGTYGVYCSGSVRNLPVSQAVMMIYFNCKPDNTQKLTDLIYEEIENMKINGPAQEDLNKAILAIYKEREEALRRNFFWDSALYGFFLNKLNIIKEKNFSKILDNMDVKRIRKSAVRFFDKADLLEVRFIPSEN